MKYLLRILLVWLRTFGKPTRGMHDLSRIRFTVRVKDLDVFGHMNNGSYLTIQDLGRLDWMLRTNTWQRLRSRGWNAVVARQTISYRKSLLLGQRYLLETRFLGVDERNFFLEHRFVREGEIYAQAFIVGRFVDKSGAVPTEIVRAEIPEIDDAHDLVPRWVREWSDAARLPSTRRETPSVWTNEPPTN